MSDSLAKELEFIEQVTVKRNIQLIKAEQYYQENQEKLDDDSRNKLSLALMKAATLIGVIVHLKRRIIEDIEAFEKHMAKAREIVKSERDTSSTK